MIQLQLEDTKKISSSIKGKGSEGELSDAKLALQLYIQELELNASILSDQQKIRSIALAVQSNRNALAKSMLQEQYAAQDQDLFCQLSRSQDLSVIKAWTVALEEIDKELLAKLAASR